MKFIFNRKQFLLLEFLDIAKKILDQKNIDPNDERFLRLRKITNKNNYYLGLLTHYVFNVGEDIDEVEQVFDLIKKYSLLLKNLNISPVEMISSEQYLKTSIYANKAKRYITGDKVYRYFFLEELEDVLKDAIIENEKDNFVKKFISNKYKHLVDSKTRELFFELKKIGEELGWDLHPKIQSLLISKLIVFKDSNELNSALETIIEQIKGGWTVDVLSEKVNKLDADIVYSDDRFVIVDTNENQKVIKELGSPKWCIVYSDSHFKSYTKFPNKQYIIFDTYLDRTDDKSLIGVTIGYVKDELGKYNTGHDRADSYISEKYLKDLDIRKYLKRMDQEEIKKNIDNLSFDEKIKYGLTEEVKKELESNESTAKSNSIKIITAVIKNKNLELLKYFVEKFQPNLNDSNYILLASENNEILKYVLSKVTDSSVLKKVGDSCFLSALHKKDFESAKTLIKYGYEPKNIKLMNPYTLFGKDMDVVNFLIKVGVDPSMNDNEFIRSFLMVKNKEMIKFLYNNEKVREKLSLAQVRLINDYLEDE